MKASALGPVVALFVILPAAPAQPSPEASSLERRKQYLETLIKILPHSTSYALTGRISAYDKDWEDAIRRTGELPPDFDSRDPALRSDTAATGGRCNWKKPWWCRPNPTSTSLVWTTN